MPSVAAFLRDWQEIGVRLRSEMLQADAAIQASLRPIVEAGAAIHQSLVSLFAESQKQWDQVISTARTSIAGPPIAGPPEFPGLTKQCADFQEVLRQSVRPAFQQILEGLAHLPVRTQEALLLLGQHGWYVDREMSLPSLWRLTDAFAEGNVLAAESALAEYLKVELRRLKN